LPSITASHLVLVRLAAAVLWAAALTAASVVLAGALDWPLEMPQLGVLVAGSALAALVALAAATLRENR
jgi:membrane protein DedA with SNARE-associated domain